MRLECPSTFYRDLCLIAKFHSTPTFTTHANGLRITGIDPDEQLAIQALWLPPQFISYRALSGKKYSWNLNEFIKVVPKDTSFLCETTESHLLLSWLDAELHYFVKLPLLPLSMVEVKRRKFKFTVHATVPVKIFSRLLDRRWHQTPEVTISLGTKGITSISENMTISYPLCVSGVFKDSFPVALLRKLTMVEFEYMTISAEQGLPLEIEYNGVKFFVAGQAK